jgi:hypothetical protein
MSPLLAFVIASNVLEKQASYITGGVYQKPQQLDGLFQYLLVGCVE